MLCTTWVVLQPYRLVPQLSSSPVNQTHCALAKRCLPSSYDVSRVNTFPQFNIISLFEPYYPAPLVRNSRSRANNLSKPVVFLQADSARVKMHHLFSNTTPHWINYTIPCKYLIESELEAQPDDRTHGTRRYNIRIYYGTRTTFRRFWAKKSRISETSKCLKSDASQVARAFVWHTPNNVGIINDLSRIFGTRSSPFEGPRH